MSEVLNEVKEQLTDAFGLRYDWFGNARELYNVIERAMVLCDGDTIWSICQKRSMQKCYFLSG